MKKHIKFSLMALGLIAGGVLTSCTNDMSDFDSNNRNGYLLKSPKIIAYSGGHVWGNNDTRGVFVNGNQYGDFYDCPNNVSQDLTAEDIENIKALLSVGHQVENEIILPWENYWVQQVYKGQAPEEAYYSHDRCYNGDCDHVNTGKDKVVGSNQMNLLLAYNDILENDWDIWGRYQFDGAMYEHVNNFNYGDNTTEHGMCACGKQHVGTTLMTGMPTTGMTPNNQFGFHETFGTVPEYYNNYLIVEYKGYYYVGFDYEAHKNDQTTHNHDEGMDVERDWNFTDWIVRISPAYPKGTNSDNPGGVTPQTPPTEEPDNCPKCGDPNENHHDGVCDDCDPGDPCKPELQPEQPEQPKETDATVDHVEINLSVEQDNGNINKSHLSIHVRSVTNVDVFIPVEYKYLVDADDMAIVEKHMEELMVHAGPTEVKYNINGNEVSFFCEILQEGIHVWTTGINEAVIEYCRETYDDGITFEIWNYFNETITPEQLRDCFNRGSVVKFLDKLPDSYINAFNDTDAGDIFEWDCTVTIVEEQIGNYEDPKAGLHYNGSEYNQIYKNKSVGSDNE